jgi:hypothetical protein
MQVLLGPLVLLVVAGILGLTIRKRNKSTKQKILATVSIAVVAVGFGVTYFSPLHQSIRE